VTWDDTEMGLLLKRFITGTTRLAKLRSRPSRIHTQAYSAYTLHTSLGIPGYTQWVSMAISTYQWVFCEK
jgi:hypothetical protein